MIARGLAAGVSLVLCAVAASDAAAQSFRTVTASRLMSGEESLDVDLQFGVGKLTVRAGNGGALYRTSIRYMEDKFRPLTDYNIRSRRLRVGIETVRGRLNLGTFKNPQLLDLFLSPTVPIDLRADVGAAEARLELGGLSIESVDIKAGAAEATVSFDRRNPIECSELSVKTGAAEFRVEGIGNSRCRRVLFAGGAGDITLDFTGEWDATTQMDADIKLTFGALRLRLPRAIGVSVGVERLLASFDAAGFTKRGSQYVSEGYDRAAAKLHVSLKAVVGDIDVVWVDR